LTGTVTDLPVVTGQTIDPGTVLMTIADMGRLVVEAVVDETHALELKTGLTATMRPTGSSEVLTGRVSRVAQVVDAATGGLAVTLTPDTALVAPIGLTVTANITIEDRSEAITVPRAAVIADEAGMAVFVLDGDIAARRAVSVIEWPAARLIVTKGLSPGDPVITDATGLTDGAAVAVAVP
jgi:RND family efflux transporter MFP subunit